MGDQQSGKKKKNGDLLQALSFFSQIGITMAVCVLIGVFAGRSLDGLLGTAPWLLLIFGLLGAGAAIKVMFDMGKGK